MGTCITWLLACKRALNKIKSELRNAKERFLWREEVGWVKWMWCKLIFSIFCNNIQVSMQYTMSVKTFDIDQRRVSKQENRTNWIRDVSLMGIAVWWGGAAALVGICPLGAWCLAWQGWEPACVKLAAGQCLSIPYYIVSYRIVSYPILSSYCIVSYPNVSYWIWANVKEAPLKKSRSLFGHCP